MLAIGAMALKKRKLSSGMSLVGDVGGEEFSADEFFSEWRSFEEITHALKSIYKKGNELTAHISLYSIGKSAEGRHILCLSVGKNALRISSDMTKKKSRKVFKLKSSEISARDSFEREEIAVVGTLHGREWSAASSVLFSCFKLIESLSNDESKVLESTFHFIPVMNPDGYEYTFARQKSSDNSEFSSLGGLNGRLWRKTRRNLCSRKMSGHKCAHGIDLNRNFGVEGLSWGFGSDKATSEVFQGKRPFSEPESKRIGEWFELVGSRLKGVLDVHCCSSSVLPGQLYRKDSDVDLQKKVESVCEGLVLDLEGYDCREREKVVSESNTGIFIDWVFNEVKVPFVFIFETIGNRKSKKMKNIFYLEKEDIKTIGLELFSSLQKLIILTEVKEKVEVKVEVEVKETKVNVEETEEFERLFKELEQGFASVKVEVEVEDKDNDEFTFITAEETEKEKEKVLVEERGLNEISVMIVLMMICLSLIIYFSLKKKRERRNKII